MIKKTSTGLTFIQVNNCLWIIDTVDEGREQVRFPTTEELHEIVDWQQASLEAMFPDKNQIDVPTFPPEVDNMVILHSCEECGSMVYDLQRHFDWHWRQRHAL